MTDTPPDAVPAQPQNGEASSPGIRVMAQFIRDFSFENPNAPESLRAGVGQPGIEMNVEMSARARDDGLYEVDLKLSAKAMREQEAVFVVELVYGGLFQIEGVPPEELEPVLLVECPRFLFPFARRMVADVTAEGGFPPFMIDPIDFGGVYAARKAQAAAQSIDGAPAGNA
jgi:preprotein translocase subunit SecB